jgi:hypothetical protein
MKNAHETLDVSRCEMTILSHAGTVVARHAFRDHDDLRSWLGYWKIASDFDLGIVRALDARWYTGLKPYAHHTDDSGSLRINVIVSGCCLSAEAVQRLADVAAEARSRAIQRRRSGCPVPFRRGPVPGTGKGTPYCFFRQKIATFGTHREAAEIPDDDEFARCTPRVRARRNAANLPSARDDLRRGIEHSWKRTRRTQWRAAR